MFRDRPWLVAALGCSILAGPAAAQTIDQQQTGSGVYLGRTGSDVGPGSQSGGWFTQSFTPTKSTAAGAGFYLTPNANVMTGTLTVELWSAAPSATGATQLASGTTALGSTANFYTAFWNAVSVTPGSAYFLAFYSAQHYDLGANYRSTYPAGYLDYTNTNTVTDPYVSNRCCVATFIEYATGAPVTTTAPEPSTWALLAAGLATVGAAARARRRG